MGTIIPVNPVEIDEQGNIRIHLAASASNEDWMHAARLLEEGKTEEFKKLDDTQNVYFIPDNETEGS